MSYDFNVNRIQVGELFNNPAVDKKNNNNKPVNTEKDNSKEIDGNLNLKNTVQITYTGPTKELQKSISFSPVEKVSPMGQVEKKQSIEAFSGIDIENRNMALASTILDSIRNAFNAA